MSYDVVEKLKKQIADFQSQTTVEEIGTVIEVADGVVKISGLPHVASQEMLAIETDHGPVHALALNLEDSSVGAVALDDFSNVRAGQTVRGLGSVLSVPVGEELVGRVINPLGEPLDGKGPIFSDSANAKHALVEKKAPSVLARKSVDTPLHTGIKSIDAMIPIGRGQRELIIGDRQTGKTSIALDAIINQQFDTARRRPVCIYVVIGQKQANVAKAIALLEERGAMAYTIVVVASASDPAPLLFLAPYSGCAIGEYFMERGGDALIVYDDLSKHAAAYRQISLLLRRPPGREAYPGDIFYLHSRLLERSAKLSDENGGGSLTALPIIETQLGDVSAYIPTNVISITDGQIYLEADLFYQGIRPAINAGLSVSRVGSSAQTKAMKKVAGKIRLELAQFRELASFVQFASDLDEATRAKIKRGQLITEALKQSDGAPLPFEHQVIVLYAVLNGFLDAIARADVAKTNEDMLAYLHNLYAGDIFEPIVRTGEFSAEVEEKTKKAILEFFASRITP
ncbi:MAG: F0F1 ATP synthase subunit alpha [Candidatus Paceibacterota bacterium]|jgi:F-type H+-transporting ATPase subunit alpha